MDRSGTRELLQAEIGQRDALERAISTLLTVCQSTRAETAVGFFPANIDLSALGTLQELISHRCLGHILFSGDCLEKLVDPLTLASIDGRHRGVTTILFIDSSDSTAMSGSLLTDLC